MITRKQKLKRGYVHKLLQDGFKKDIYLHHILISWQT